jgi:hypothetical protein
MDPNELDRVLNIIARELGVPLSGAEDVERAFAERRRLAERDEQHSEHRRTVLLSASDMLDRVAREHGNSEARELAYECALAAVPAKAFEPRRAPPDSPRPAEAFGTLIDALAHFGSADLAETDSGMPAYVARVAARAAGPLPLNRPRTKPVGETLSEPPPLLDSGDAFTANAVMQAVAPGERLTMAEAIARISAYREHSVVLACVDHALMRGDGPRPTSPFPVGVDVEHILTRVDTVIEGLNAAATALGKVTHPPKRIVRRVGLFCSSLMTSSLRSIEEMLMLRGIEVLSEVVALGSPMETAMDALSSRLQCLGGGVLLAVSGGGVVSEPGTSNWMPLSEWLSGIEVRS